MRLFRVVFDDHELRMFVEIQDLIGGDIDDRMGGKIIGLSGNRALGTIVERNP